MHKYFNLEIIKKTKWFALVAILFASILLPNINVSAQSNGLGITPRLSYTISAGSQRSDTLYVNNLSTSQPLNLKLRVIDFRAQDESGTPQLLKEANAPSTAWSLKQYLTLPENVKIEPGKSKLIPFTLKIPGNVGAGSYYSAVEYTALNDAGQEKVNVAASSATLLFVTVPGDAKEQLSLVQFGAYEGNKFKSIFGSKPPQTFAYRVKNNGNISESPAGSIVIKNIFGKIVASIDSANPRSELVLLGQTRRFEVCYPKSTNQDQLGKSENCQHLKINPGFYTAEIQMLYGLNGQQSRQIGGKASFWYLPIWFIVLVLVVLVAVGYGGYRLYRKLSAPKHKKK
jgi:hypothetical protein